MPLENEGEFDAFLADLAIPPFGLKIRFSETGPAVESGETCLQPGVAGPPVHFHAAQDERFEVRSGVLQVLVDRDWRTIEAGQAVEVPRLTPHTYRNRSREVCRFAYRLTPGGGFTRMMYELAELAATGKLRGLSNPRSIIYLAMLFVRYRDEVQSTRPPMFVMHVLARVGQWLGFRMGSVERHPEKSRPLTSS
jgi:mannose-6-phosphate isomerase-like protein (cupin superfamily)